MGGVDPRPIGMFDSGFGGLTVARALIDLLPDEDLVYVGDTGRYPYGPRPLDEVRGFAHQITEHLLADHDVKLVVVACNTASAAALGELQELSPVPVVGVIEPGVRSLVAATRNGHVGVIGTTARWLVPKLLEGMREAHPQVQLVVVEATSTGLEPQLASGQLDLAVVNLPLPAPDLVAEPLFDEDLVLVVNSDHPLAGRDEVSFKELDGLELLMAAPNTAYRNELDAAASAAGITLIPKAELDGIRLMASLTFEGHGPAIVPATAIPQWLPRVVWRPIAISGLPAAASVWPPVDAACPPPPHEPWPKCCATCASRALARSPASIRPSSGVSPTPFFAEREDRC